MKNKVLLSSFLCLALSFSACGGGGGGGEHAKDNSIFNINSSGKEYMSSGMRFIHAVTDAKPLQIAASDKVVAAPLRYSFSNYLSLSSGSYNLQVYKTNEPVRSIDLNFSDTSRATLLYCGSLKLGIEKVNLLQHQDVDKGSSAIRGIHALYSAGNLRFVFNGEEFDADFCGATKYLTTAAGGVSVEVYRKSDNYQIVSQSFSLEGGKAYSLILSGDLVEDYSVRLSQD